MQFRHHTQTLAALAGAALCCALTAGPAAAQDSYPSHPIRIIVPFAAGGGPDIEARKLAVPLAEALNGNVVVENRVGAAGIIAAEVAAQAAPDGYTLLYGSSSQLIQKILKPKATFDPEKSFAPITLIATSPGVLTVANTSSVKTVQDLVAAARAHPGELNYSSGGIGTAAHLAGATFCVVTKIDAVHVPLRGSVEILQSLVGGLTQFAFPVAGTGVPQVKSGRLRGLAVTSRARMKQLPDLPSLFEVYKDESLVQESWDALWAPAGTPAPIINKLFAAAVKASQNPAFHTQVESQGSAVVNSKSPADLAAYMHAENAKWNKIIQLAKIPTE
ncbi:MAG TPA: tripartite tricarboxylate transporter substrate-binding protein [Burkholderiales bacterium]|jgi:tripartite-type tricarboxylate transporter receptor subunit TctC